MSNEVRDMRDFHSLEIWKKSHSLTLSIYEITAKQFPNTELFALTSQLRRAVSSIPINIAEGCGRKSKKDLAHFIQIAIGSSSEVEYQLFLAKDLKYINENTWRALNNNVIEIRKMMFAFANKLTPQGS
ncbi:MAG: four helix bundle protein [Fibrobacter sp.]|nr:four helix bundle protein [Fibrobacter sp.]